jgi:hypothetical protein
MGFSRCAVVAAAIVTAAMVVQGAGSVGSAPDVQNIVRRSVDAIKQDWADAPKYSWVQRDVESKHDGVQTSKTYRVLMLDGSPYNVVTEIDGQPLSPAETAAEQKKLAKEIVKRRNESDRERARRTAKYAREQQRNHAMLQEMVDAFRFSLAGQARVNGHDCWVLDAEPKPDFDPPDHEGRVLKGMQGKLWIDKATYQWVRVQAEVVRPVSFYGFLAKVEPGTQFYLEQEPVASGIWLPKVFDVRVQATALGLFSENSTENDTYRDYQPMPQAMALLQSSR